MKLLLISTQFISTEMRQNSAQFFKKNQRMVANVEERCTFKGTRLQMGKQILDAENKNNALKQY